MPAAAKLEKINNSGSTAVVGGGDQKLSNINNNNNANNDPTKIANTIIEKKIRNLEKRKARLLDIKALDEGKKQLQPDQIEALKKLDSVLESIDMLKEINKNISESLNDYAKQQKKQMKKEQQEKLIERNQCELERIKLFLRIQKILPCVTYLKQLNNNNNQQTANDLTNDNNGDGNTADSKDGDNDNNVVETVKPFDDKHIDALESLAQILNIDGNFDQYAEKVHLILDGSKKEFSNGISHSEMKEVFIKIIENKYLDNIKMTPKQNDESPIESNNNCSQVKDSVSANESQSKTNEKTQVTDTDNQVRSSSTESANKQQVETDLQKDPAVIASGYAYPSFTNGNCPVNFLSPTTNNMDYSPLLLHQTAVGSIPSQQFTNQNYVNFIHNKVPIFDQAGVPVVPINQVPFNDKMTCNAGEQQQQQPQSNSAEKFNGVANEKSIDQIEGSEKSENLDGLETTSQHDNDPKVNVNADVNGHGGGGSSGGYQKRQNYRGRGGSNGRGGGSSFRGGRSNNPNKNFGGYFNGNGGGSGGHQQNSVNNYNGTNRSQMTRYNGGGGRGSYRGSNDRGGSGINRNNNNNHYNNSNNNNQQSQQQQGPTVNYTIKQ